jgi:hypothetical protein
VKARIVVDGSDADRESLRVWLSREPVLRGRITLDGTHLVVIASMGQTPPETIWAAVAKGTAVWLNHRRSAVSATVAGPSGQRVTVTSGQAGEAEEAVLRTLSQATRVGPDQQPRELIESCRTAFGPPPRQFDPYDVDGYLRVPRPAWVTAVGRGRGAEYYHDLLAWQGELRRSGRIVWGNIVQANVALFRPGDDDDPAAFVYSPDPAIDNAPHRLSTIAGSLFDLKGADVGDPALQRFADTLEDERETIGKLAVPPTLTGGIEVFYTVALVCRRHLPARRLRNRMFPLLVLPEQTTATMILPSRYWPEALLSEWRS